MAIDQTNKRRAIAREIMNGIDQMMTGLYAARDAVNERASAGLVFAAADFEDSADLKHLTTANIATAESNVTSLLGTIEAAFQDDVFNLVRP